MSFFWSHLHKTEKNQINERMQLTNRVGFDFKKFWGIKKDRKKDNCSSIDIDILIGNPRSVFEITHIFQTNISFESDDSGDEI